MLPSDVAGIFSRYFVVGFFLPAFFSAVGLSTAATTTFLPTAYQHLSGGAQIAVLGGVGLLLGLLLVGLNWQVFRLYEGYPLNEHQSLFAVGWLRSLLIWKQRRSFDSLMATRENSLMSDDERGEAAWRLDRAFPPSREEIMPTSFGNAVLAFESHSRTRWGLDSIVAWPRIDLLLTEREGEQQANARSEAAFFVNGSLLTFLSGGVLIADQLADSSLKNLELLLYLIPFLMGFLLMKWSVGAAVRWGSTVRSAIDLHRFDLYEKLGIRAPTGFSDEFDVADKLSQKLLYGYEISDDYFRPPKDLGDHPNE
jgi:hypothetical protein